MNINDLIHLIATLEKEENRYYNEYLRTGDKIQLRAASARYKRRATLEKELFNLQKNNNE